MAQSLRRTCYPKPYNIHQLVGNRSLALISRGRGGYVYFGLGDTETQEGSGRATEFGDEDMPVLVQLTDNNLTDFGSDTGNGDPTTPNQTTLPAPSQLLGTQGPGQCLRCYQWQAEAQWYRDRYHDRHEELFVAVQATKTLKLLQRPNEFYNLERVSAVCERRFGHKDVVRVLEDSLGSW